MQGSIGKNWRFTTEAHTERAVEAAVPRSRYQVSLSFLFFYFLYYLLVNLQLYSLLHFNLFIPDTRTFVGATPRTLPRAEFNNPLGTRLRYLSHCNSQIEHWASGHLSVWASDEG